MSRHVGCALKKYDKPQLKKYDKPQLRKLGRMDAVTKKSGGQPDTGAGFPTEPV